MGAEVQYVLIIWGKGFDEVDAITFASAMRQSGMRTKIVGIDGANRTGNLGIALMPDMTLEQGIELLSLTVCIILPCHSRQWHRLTQDPRYRMLMQTAAERNIYMVFREDGRTTACCDEIMRPNPSIVLSYHSDYVNEFAFDLADKLAGCSNIEN
ncbi:MAG: hypothetical protein H6642_05550 [Caldilineaceae bacterium]|nr:hypothetical protein [Caldilineaceae bacterium]